MSCTNATVWRVYQVIFAKPIDKRLLVEIDLSQIDPRKEDQLERVYLLTREGFLKGAHLELRDKQDATSRYTLAALMLHNETVMSAIRRELRKLVDVLVDEEAILKVLRDEVIKRDALEGPSAESAARRVNRSEAAQRAAKTVASKNKLGVADADADAAPAVEVTISAPRNAPGAAGLAGA